MKTGIIDTGGGLRGVYAAGVLDYCLENRIQFDFGIGISASSANITSFAAGQKKRNHKFYTVYSQRRQYMGISNFLFKHTFIDMDYVYGTLSNSGGEYPLDYTALQKNPIDFLIIATDAETGKPRYFTRKDLPLDNYQILKASCAIPSVCKPYPVYGKYYYDGALGDPIPVEKAFENGCEKVILILTRPESEPRTPDKDIKLAKHIQKRYPAAADQLRRRADHYNQGVELAQKYASEGKLLIISPDNTCGVDTLTRDAAALNKLYEKGFTDAAKIPLFLAAS